MSASHPDVNFPANPASVKQTIKEALEYIERSGERVHEADFYRLKGLVERQHESDQFAEASFERALDIAREQESRSLELRAARDLARLWRDHGKTNEASDLLAPVYGWFTEGFDTADLKDVKALLDELG